MPSLSASNIWGLSARKGEICGHSPGSQNTLKELEIFSTFQENWKYFRIFKKIENVFWLFKGALCLFNYRDPCVFSTIGTPVSISRHLSLKSKNIPPRTLLSHSQQIVNQLMNWSNRVRTIESVSRQERVLELIELRCRVHTLQPFDVYLGGKVGKQGEKLCSLYNALLAKKQTLF